MRLAVMERQLPGLASAAAIELFEATEPLAKQGMCQDWARITQLQHLSATRMLAHEKVRRKRFAHKLAAKEHQLLAWRWARTPRGEGAQAQANSLSHPSFSAQGASSSPPGSHGTPPAGPSHCCGSGAP